MTVDSAHGPAYRQKVCLYGHFYQPPREDPFSGQIPQEPGAEPYPNFNEKITVECYRPNAEAGNFEHISFDVGPTLAAWLEHTHPDVHARILAADHANVRGYGVGNALAQPYIHSILPLATLRDRRTLIAWGLDDFTHHYGRSAEGMWLPETAADLETLDLLAERGIRYTVLAPWQAADPIDPSEPYVVRLPGGRAITVFFYNGPLSRVISFDDAATRNADVFAAHMLPAQLNAAKSARGEDQLLLIAADGELYGHHKRWRDQFLTRLVHGAASAQGFEVVTLARYLVNHPATREVRLHAPSSWSCEHGLARWSTGCPCTAGDPSWKAALRRALDRLSVKLDTAYEAVAGTTLCDPWAARDAAIGLHEGWSTPDEWWARFGIGGHPPTNPIAARQTLQLLEAQYYGQCMYTSCALFIDDLDRIEPRNGIAAGRRAISLVWQATGRDLQADFVEQLAAARSWQTGVTGAELYHQLPVVARAYLPANRRDGAAPG